jgi:hypothetical protein
MSDVATIPKDLLSRIIEHAIGDVFRISDIIEFLNIPTFRTACLDIDASKFVTSELLWIDGYLYGENATSKRPRFEVSTFETIIRRLKTISMTSAGNPRNVLREMHRVNELTMEIDTGSEVDIMTIPPSVSSLSLMTHTMSSIHVSKSRATEPIDKRTIDRLMLFVTGRDRLTDKELLGRFTPILVSNQQYPWLYISNGAQDSYEVTFVKCQCFAILTHFNPVHFKLVMPEPSFYSLLLMPEYIKESNLFSRLRVLEVGSEVYPMTIPDGSRLIDLMEGLEKLSIWVKSTSPCRCIYIIPKSIEVLKLFVPGFACTTILLVPKTARQSLDILEVYSERGVVLGASKVAKHARSISVSGSALYTFCDQCQFDDDGDDDVRGTTDVRIRLTHDLTDELHPFVDMVIPAFATSPSIGKLVVELSDNKWNTLFDPSNDRPANAMAASRAPVFVNVRSSVDIKSIASFRYVMVSLNVLSTWDAKSIQVWAPCWVYMRRGNHGWQATKVDFDGKGRKLANLHVTLEKNVPRVSTPLLDWMASLIDTHTTSYDTIFNSEIPYDTSNPDIPEHINQSLEVMTLY